MMEEKVRVLLDLMRKLYAPDKVQDTASVEHVESDSREGGVVHEVVMSDAAVMTDRSG